MTASTEQLSAAYEARNKFMEKAHAQIKDLIGQGHYEAANQLHANLMGQLKSSPLDEILKQRTSQAANVAKDMLPKGISNGRMALYVAGTVALAGGALALYNSHQSKKKSWAAQIDAEKQNQPITR